MAFIVVLVALLVLAWLGGRFGADSRPRWTDLPMDEWPFHRSRG
jgi:hypothetical protein